LRVYIPATTTTLRELAERSTLGPGPLTAFAVTPGVRSWYADDDEDELEYAANGQAVRASLRMVDADPAARRRRVVLSADVPDALVDQFDDLDRGAVRVGYEVRLADLAAIHIDDVDAEATVARAAAVVIEADLGLTSAQDAVDDAEGFELSWFAPQELGDLIATVETDS
jgi:hypothetical protein